MYLISYSNYKFLKIILLITNFSNMSKLLFTYNTIKKNHKYINQICFNWKPEFHSAYLYTIAALWAVQPPVSRPPLYRATRSTVFISTTWKRAKCRDTSKPLRRAFREFVFTDQKLHYRNWVRSLYFKSYSYHFLSNFLQNCASID